jgi:hypothetical protein
VNAEISKQAAFCCWREISKQAAFLLLARNFETSRFLLLAGNFETRTIAYFCHFRKFQNDHRDISRVMREMF